MSKTFVCRTLVAASLIALAGSLPPGAEERAKVPEKYTWNLSDLYASRAAWSAARDEAEAKLPEVTAYRGRLGQSAGTLLEALNTLMDVKKSVVRLSVYAMQLRDQDTRVAENAALSQSAEQLVNRFGEAASFVGPEILAMGPEKVAAFVAQEPGLKPYQPYLDDILRLKAHTRSPEVERVLAQAESMAGTPDSVYGQFTGAEFPYPEVALSTGEKATLDPSGFARARASSNREDRMKAFKAFFEAQDGFKGTLGTLLYGQVLTHLFNRDARGYKSCVEAALDQNAIPVAVYERLVSDTHENLPTLYRYLRLRQRMMGLDSLRYEDLYAPTVKSVEMSFTPEQAMDLTLKAFAPLGQAYVDTLKKGYESRWVDWYPSTGKRSGAYSEGAAYDVHPYQLLNFNGRYVDVATLAHESGHSMHYYLSNHNQPFVTSEHATFVAEVASTLNESLLFRYMLANAKDDDTRLFLLNQRLDGFRQTLFRQTLFAEFELRVHQMAEAGKPVTGESLSALYLDLLRTYYGHSAGVCTVEPYCASEWAYIHHFWAYDFYVYQYATSLTASTAISKAIREEEAGKPPQYKTRDAYLKMLSSGCSSYPIDLLKGVGVDMTTSAPFKAAMAEMNEIMDQMEAILAREAGK